MDVQQLTTLPARGSWSLREEGHLPPLEPWWLDAADDAPEERATPEAAGRAPGRGLVALAVAATIAFVLAGAALLAGFRWFVVETPSMGGAAPVGSLVVTRDVAGVHRGEIVAFTPPGTARVYTHRVVEVAADGSFRTQGDINATPDPWTVRPAAVLGGAVAIVPAAGFAVRAVPPLVVGVLLVQLVTLPIRRRDRRAAARVLGWHLVATVVVLWLQPLVRVVLVAGEAATDGLKASVVSTGLLPVRLVTSAGDVLARLTDGVPRTVTMPTGVARLTAVPDLTPTAQAALVLLAVLPAIAVLLIGLPKDDRA
jgi:signal peptidase I